MPQTKVFVEQAKAEGSKVILTMDMNNGVLVAGKAHGKFQFSADLSYTDASGNTVQRNPKTNVNTAEALGEPSQGRIKVVAIFEVDTAPDPNKNIDATVTVLEPKDEGTEIPPDDPPIDQ